MSAFICGPDHFKVLALFAATRRNSGIRVNPAYIKALPDTVKQSDGTELATAYADILYQENIRSVRARYPKDKRDELPGPNVLPLHIVITGQDACSAKYRLPAVSVLKMCDCLEYQSCETDDYRQTVAFELLDAIRGAAIGALPGYNDAPWDYYAKEDRKTA